jgi:hypothetical protein
MYNYIAKCSESTLFLTTLVIHLDYILAIRLDYKNLERTESLFI